MEYAEMSCNALKAELARRDIKTTGNKAALIERLEADDERKEIDAAKITFLVKTLMGSWYTIKVDSNQTILDLKNELNSVMGAPVDKIRLTNMHRNKHTDLPNDYVVSDFGLNEIMLDMMTKLR